VTIESIHSLKKENAQLQKELAFSRDLLESANSIIIRWGKDGFIRYINNYGLRFFGYSPAELIGQPIMLLVPKTETSTGRDLSELASQVANNPEQNIAVQNENITRDGQIVWVAWTNKGVFDQHGKLQEILTIGNDITATKTAEQALWNYQQKLNSALEGMNDAVFISDSQGNFIHFNTAFATFHKFKDKNECLAKLADYPKLLDVFLPAGELLPLEQWVVSRALRGESGTNAEYTLVRKDTGEKWTGSYNFGPLFDQQGNIAGSVIVARDITEQKNAQEVLRKANLNLSLAQRIANIGNWTLDPEIGVPEWSDEIYRIYERDPELGPLSLNDYKKIYQGEWFEKFNSAIQGAINQGQPYDIELKIEFSKDKSKWVHAICEPEKHPGSKRYYLRGTIQDITERKQAEQAQQELQILFQQKSKMEAIGVMAGGMAHNFNNNLAVILGNLELAKAHLPPQSGIEGYLDYMKIASLRSRDLVKKIMTYSRISPPSHTPLQFAGLLSEIVSLLQSTIPSSVTLKLEIHADSAHSFIMADAHQIQECLLNLSNNAVHAMDEQGVLSLELSRETLRQSDIPPRYDCMPGEYLCLSVQDTGCGIASEIQEKIFDPFFTTKELYEGTGMGLATVQGIIADHHGFITLLSEESKGTIFRLFFPTVETPHQDDGKAAEDGVMKGSERILFVDDDEMLSALNQRLLSEAGYQVTVQTDSVAALHLFSKNAQDFDLVITDQTMPEMTGMELIQNIKQQRPDIPTILCTGYSSKVDEEKIKQSGVSAFLLKPVELKEMSQAIRTVIDD
jgi:PAS domain S-box-containing protein